LLKHALLAGMVLFAPLAGRAAPYEDGIVALRQHEFAKARDLFTQAAEAGDATAQSDLGRMYLVGEGGPQDYAQALKWSKAAAEAGIPAAQYNLGRIYDEALGVGRDLQAAGRWYRRAADKGFSSALVALGDMYAAGRGAPPDPKRAAELYGVAAGQGDPRAAHALEVLSREQDLGLGGLTPRARFTALMDSVFGPKAWRQTGGFRTARRENELRAQGALTVPVGAVSAHSRGNAEAPGAYDLVVKGLSPEQAARKLRASKAPLKVIFPEAAHGSQGPHLHVEPVSASFHATPLRPAEPADPAKVEDAARWLRAAATRGPGLVAPCPDPQAAACGDARKE
jgi:TPR repeat protein